MPPAGSPSAENLEPIFLVFLQVAQDWQEFRRSAKPFVLSLVSSSADVGSAHFTGESLSVTRQ